MHVVRHSAPSQAPGIRDVSHPKASPISKLQHLTCTRTPVPLVDQSLRLRFPINTFQNSILRMYETVPHHLFSILAYLS